MKIASIPPRSAQQVASGGLGRTDRKAAVCAEQGFDCREFAFVAHRGRGGVGIQVLNLGCVHAGLAQCLLHGAAGAVAIFGPGGHVVRVGAGAIAHQLGDGCGAACQGMLQLFDDQQAGAFTHDETIAGLIERQPYSQRPLRYQYVPTAKGEDFRVVLMAFVAWGNRHYAPEGESVQIVERETGRPVLPMMADVADGRLVPLDQCSVQAGPAASAGMRQRFGCMADRIE